jgi:hypothetical protein
MATLVEVMLVNAGFSQSSITRFIRIIDKYGGDPPHDELFYTCKTADLQR